MPAGHAELCATWWTLWRAPATAWREAWPTRRPGPCAQRGLRAPLPRPDSMRRRQQPIHHNPDRRHHSQSPCCSKASKDMHSNKLNQTTDAQTPSECRDLNGFSPRDMPAIEAVNDRQISLDANEAPILNSDQIHGSTSESPRTGPKQTLNQKGRSLRREWRGATPISDQNRMAATSPTKNRQTPRSAGVLPADVPDTAPAMETGRGSTRGDHLTSRPDDLATQP